MTPLGLLLSNTLNFTYGYKYPYFQTYFQTYQRTFFPLNLTTAKLQRFFIPYKFSD